MYKKGENVIMTKCSAPKLPNVKDGGGFRMSFLRGPTTMFSHERHVKTHILPGIGTFVIDTPKDKELSARQRCFRYQEAHRGVIRSKTKAFPDIPKRCGMKNLPIVQLRDLNVTVNENTTPTRLLSPVEGQGSSASPGLTESSTSCHSADGCREKPQKLETTLKTQSQDGPASRTPVARTLLQTSGEHRCSASPVMVNGFGVRRGKSVVATTTMPGAAACSTSRREFTNLTKNLLLAEPEVTPCKATERELESQAEYRKQLTFYLSQMFEAEQDQQSKVPRKKDADDDQGANDVHDDENNIHVDNIGHTSKHQEWESSISLGEMLINTTPDLRKRLKLDFKIRETGSGKSSNVTPEVGKLSAKQYLASRGFDTVNDKIYRNNVTNSNGNSRNNNDNNNDNNIGDSRDNRADKVAKSTQEKLPLPPKRRPTCVNSQNGGLKDNGRGISERVKNTRPLNDNNNIDNEEDEEEEEDGNALNIQNDDSQHENEEGDDSEEEDEGDQYDVIVDEKWLHMVNTPVVESWGYDRYANVKLPVSWLKPNPYNLHERTSPGKNAICSTSGNRGFLPGACAMSGNGSTSSPIEAPGKTVGFIERKTASRVK